MKIYQFTVPLAENKKINNKSSKKLPEEDNFAQILKTSSKKASSALGGVISLENKRAANQPSAEDINQATNLLMRLNDNIRHATPEALKKVHDLEGLVYVYSPNSIL
ncbi:MAG: hypothetical protein ACRCTY_06245 [Candidatus Adiutrix sp.]